MRATFFVSLISVCSAYTWPDYQYDALESLLFEGRRSDGSSLASLVHPCRKRTNTLASVPAEWLRFAFHDMATHNVDDGTGGMDGSIVYELGRPENFGLGFNQTLSDFELYPNKLISRADVISIGAIMAVATCGGPILPLRGGRVDVWQAGAVGTPEPQDDLPTLTELFRKQGFNQAEMIKLVACGHTMGGVRSADFPQLVPPDPNSVNPVIVDFDKTMDFDNHVVTDYLSGTTQNVLVVGPNATMNSDLRVFEADNNQTMQTLSTPQSFASECQTMLTRMLDAVPSTVSLSQEITLLPAKVNNALLTIERNKLVFKVSLRLQHPTNATAPANRVVTLLWCDKYGPGAGCTGSGSTTSSSRPVKSIKEDPNLSPVTLNMGYAFYTYNFVVPITSAASLGKFWFEVDDTPDGGAKVTYDNGGGGYVYPQDSLLWVPSMGHMDLLTDGVCGKACTTTVGPTTSVYRFAVAVREGLNPSQVYGDATDVAVKGFTAPITLQVPFALNSTLQGVDGYSFWTGEAQSLGMQLTMDLHAVGGGGGDVLYQFAETTVLDGGQYVAPGNVSKVGAKLSGGAAGAYGVVLGVWGGLLAVGVGVVLSW